MTQQQLLQSARDVVAYGAKFHRKDLQSYAHAMGRSSQSVKKASTFRLALWISKGTSAI